jgi:hypothetical protein
MSLYIHNLRYNIEIFIIMLVFFFYNRMSSIHLILNIIFFYWKKLSSGINIT